MEKPSYSFNHELPACGRSWRDVERAMDHARNLRAQTCADLAAAGLRALLRLLPRSQFGLAPGLRGTAAFVLMLALGLLAMSGSAPAQDAREIRLELSPGDPDTARLAALGLDAASIESSSDVTALWRAVRELVLPGRISEPMQQRILRRVWIADAAIREAPIIAGTDH